MKLVYKHDFGVYMQAYIIEKQCEESIHIKISLIVLKTQSAIPVFMRRSNKARGKGRGIKRKMKDRFYKCALFLYLFVNLTFFSVKNNDFSVCFFYKSSCCTLLISLLYYHPLRFLFVGVFFLGGGLSFLVCFFKVELLARLIG